MYHYTTLYNQLIGIIFIYLVQLNQIGIIFLLSSSGYSASGYTPQSAVHVLLNLVIAHITYDFIHNYFLNSRFVMQDGIIHRIFKEQEPILCSEQLNFRFFISSLHFSVHRVISTAFYFIAICCNGFF